MKKSFITKMPDKAGAFLAASRIIASHGGNIVRVNYNKSIDIHTLFIDVSASQGQLETIGQELAAIGYLAEPAGDKRVLLISLKLLDIPGSVTAVLEILQRHEVNITYLSSQENGTGYQHFKMGLYFEDAAQVRPLMEEIAQKCEVVRLEYDATEKIVDNSVFYSDFENKIRAVLPMTEEEADEFLVNSNRIMQMLDERNELPYKTFEYIYRFAEFVMRHKGVAFRPRITCRQLAEGIILHLIEPPCGSNTYVFETPTELLFVDCGFACYREEMLAVFRELFPDFDTRPKSIVLTHSDIDHSGIASLFDAIYVSDCCYENFLLESRGMDNFREQSPLNHPYCKLSRIISGYHTPDMRKMRIIGHKIDDEPLSYIGDFTAAGLTFSVWEGSGGHIRGESILFCDAFDLVFTGDNFVNIRGFSREQREFNALAPYLMTSVDVDPPRAAVVRKTLMEKCHGKFLCPAHGDWTEYGK